jgi:hypothetical protein
VTPDRGPGAVDAGADGAADGQVVERGEQLGAAGVGLVERRDRVDDEHDEALGGDPRAEPGDAADMEFAVRGSKFIR